MAVGETPNDYLAGDPLPAAPVQAAAPSTCPRPDRAGAGSQGAAVCARTQICARAGTRGAARRRCRSDGRARSRTHRQELDELRAILEGFEGCALKATATRLVFADGNPQARVMFVGEAPGRDEDIEGLPFVGRSGKLLDRMLAAIGLDRTKVYIANIVPWRPPGNRTPTPVETQICLPFMLRQIELCEPDIVVTHGQSVDADAVANIRRHHHAPAGAGFRSRAATRDIRVMPTFHPAFLLRSPLQKRFAWRDFLAIKKALG